MSGILGLWNLDGRPVEATEMRSLAVVLAHRGGDFSGCWVQGPVGLACQLRRVTPESATEVQPLEHPSGSLIVFDGRLDNRQELLGSLPFEAALSPDAPDPELVLAAYSVYGDHLPEKLAGDFALGLFDARRRRLLLARDAIGTRPLYYFRSQSLFLFASEIKAILAHPAVSARPDPDAIAGMVLGHCQSPEATCFAGIANLPASHAGVLAGDSWQVRKYWDFDGSRTLPYKTFPEYAEAFREVLETAVRRRLRSSYPVAATVSGGLDSSSIFCVGQRLRQATPQSFPPLTGISLTYPEGKPPDERQFLDLIERQYGISIQRVPAGPPGMLDFLEKMILGAEMPIGNAQMNSFHELLEGTRRQGARVLLLGVWGDQAMFSQAYLVDFVRRLQWRKARQHLRTYPRWMTDADPLAFRRQFRLDLRQMLIPDALRPTLRLLRDALTDGNQQIGLYSDDFRRRARESLNRPYWRGGPFTNSQARSIYRMVRWLYHVDMLEWHNKISNSYGFDAAFPFLDRDLVAFMMAVPGEIQAWNGVPRALLRESMIGILPEEIVRRTWKADFTFYINEGMVKEFDRLTAFLEHHQYSVRAGYVEETVLQDKLRTLRARFDEPYCSVALELALLVDLEMWQKVFLYGGTNRAQEVRP